MAVCHFEKPLSITPYNPTQDFEYDISAGTQTINVEFAHYTLTNFPECGTYTYTINGKPNFVDWNPSSDPTVNHVMTINISSAVIPEDY